MTYPSQLDTDDIDELAAYIERRYPTEEIRIHNTETIHFGYWDKSTRIVSAMLLDHIQAAGYRILHTGIATLPRRSTRRAWMECRKHEAPDEDVDRDENSEGFTLSCDYCREGYTLDEARTIAIFGPNEIRYTCPQCGHGTDGPPPIATEKWSKSMFLQSYEFYTNRLLTFLYHHAEFIVNGDDQGQRPRPHRGRRCRRSPA